MIPDSFKQDLLNRVDIVELVSRYVQLKKAGANYLGLCPFHDEKTPSFTVSPAKQFYHCFGCQKHGNAIGFLMEHGGMGYIDALKDLAAGVGMQVPQWQPRSPEEAQRKERETDLYALMDKAMNYYRAKLKETPRAVQYLKGRGLEGRIAGRFGIGYASEDWQGLKAAFSAYEDKALVDCGLVIENEGKRYDRFRDRIMFPIFNVRGAVIGFGGRVLGEGEPKYLNSPETPLFEKGRELYGLPQAMDSIRTAKRALVVEGYMDVVALAQFGVGYAVATLGTATTPVHISKLLRYADEVVFCFDGDAAGRKAAWRALEVGMPLATDHKPMRFLFLPDGEDPDTFVRRNGKDAFERLIAESETLTGFLMSELRAQSDLTTMEGRARFLSIAKPYMQKLTAPALRLQALREVGELGRVTDAELERLMEIPRAARYSRPAPAKRSYNAPDSLEWGMLVSLISDLGLVIHINASLLAPELEETRALLAIQEICAGAAEEPSFPIVMEALEGNTCLATVLKAHKYSSDLGLDAEAAKGQFLDALSKLDLRRRKQELDSILARGLTSSAERVDYQEKLTLYKRLQGVLPEAAPPR